MQLPEEAKKFDKINKESVSPRPVVSMRLVAISRPRAWSRVLQRTASDRVATRLLSSSEDGHESRTLRQHGSRVDGHGLLGAHVGPIFKIVVLALLLGLRASELV